MEDLIYFGGEVKAVGGGKVAGYLVRFGTQKETDLEGDYFTAETDFGFVTENKTPVFYQHGYDSQLKGRSLGSGSARFDDIGLWFEAQLEMRDEYEKAIYELVEQGKLGWSSGAAGHLVTREQTGKAWHIKSWLVAEASLTPTPAEPRNHVMPVKSLFHLDKEENKMEENIKEVQPTAPVDIEAIVKSAVGEARKAFAEDLKEHKAGFDTAVKKMEVEDEVDRAVKGNPFTKQDFFKAVHTAAVAPHMTDKRLYAMKAPLGMNEAIPSQGGFLVPTDIAGGIFQNMWNTGSLLNLMTPTSVSGNGLTVNAIDETSRVNGSRMGGVRGYWIAEAGTKLATKPKFRQITLRLKKIAALLYATDELLDDAQALESWIVNNVPAELRFVAEDAIINGTGAGMPLGILPSGALVSAVRTDANEIDSFDITRMWARRYAGVNDYVWLCNANIAPQLYNMTLGNYPVYLPPGGFSGSMYGSLMGRPVIETEYNPALGSVGDLLLISPSQYAMINKGGIEAASSIHVQFVTDETAFRFVYRMDGQPLWDTPVTPFKGSDTVSPFVALLATT